MRPCDLAARKHRQPRQRRVERVAVGDNVGVVAGEVASPRLQRCGQRDTRGVGHRLPDARRDHAVADLARLRLGHDRARGVERLQRGEQARLEHLLARLALPDAAEDGAAMVGERLQVQRLHPARGEPAEDLGLARAGGALEQHEIERPVVVVEPLAHATAIRLVAAGEHRRAPTHLREDDGHGARALAASPAVDERRKPARLVGERRLEIAGDVAGDQRRPDAAGAKPRLLHVDGPDLRPFGVAQHRQADRAGHVILERSSTGYARR